MLNEKENSRISKFLSLVLRHQPESAGIVLDNNGWTDVQILIENINKTGLSIDLTTLQYIVETNSKKRFSFNETGDKIRASQGHSVSVDLGYTPKKPPAVLYHGTGEKAVVSIFNEGLIKRERQHVHLSSDIETAIKVGQRHGNPFVLEVLTEEMCKDGYIFYLSENGVWLTDHVPVKYLKQCKRK